MYQNRILKAAQAEIKAEMIKPENEEADRFDWKSIALPEDFINLTDVKQNQTDDFMSNYKYWALYCFTGYGVKSVKYINQYSNTLPVISTCESLYPDSNDWSLKNLETAVNNAPASNSS